MIEIYQLLQKPEVEEIFLSEIAAPAGALDVLLKNRREIETAPKSVYLKDIPKEELLKRWVEYLRTGFHTANFIASHQCIDAHQLTEELAEDVCIKLKANGDPSGDNNLQRHVVAAASVHDVSRSTFSIDILYGLSEPNEAEMRYLKLHAFASYCMIRNIKALRHLHPTILFHEEFYMGGGPVENFINTYLLKEGIVEDQVDISGERIPLSARILAIPDAYASMVRREKTPEEIRAKLVEQRGREFDPELIDMTLQILESNGKL